MGKRVIGTLLAKMVAKFINNQKRFFLMIIFNLQK